MDVSLSTRASQALGARVVLAVARAPVPRGSLSQGELSQLSALGTEARREEWCLGRAALKEALDALGEGRDTAPLAFPNQRLSLTHSGPLAVAAASADGDLAGIGVDLEIGRGPPLEGARFFLTDDEEAWVRGRPDAECPGHLLRVWTVKEAIFKADPDNATATLRSYRLFHPHRGIGGALRVGGRAFRYAALRLGFATLSAAIHRSPS